MSFKQLLSDYPDVSFIDNLTMEDVQEFYINAMKEKYRELTGTELVMEQADPLRLIAYADCLLLYQILQYADRAGKMSLLKYSYGDYLENIGALKGVSRMEGASAMTRMRFTLSMRRNNVTIIPAGTRVTSGDRTYFETSDILEIPAGQLSGEVNAVCKEKGIVGNGYKAGELNILVDPIPYIGKAENIALTEGGADIEADENLAERIYLAPSSWSTAGPDDAYKYWVMTFDPAITDVCVDSETPGVVNICFILQDGQIPEVTMIDELESYLQNEKVRPLTDKVVVGLPDIKEYEVDITYYVNKSDRMKAAAIQEQVQEAVREYIAWQKERIGRDINPDQLRKRIISAGAKRVEIRSPDFVRISRNSIALLVAEEKVLYGGVEDD
ncbi:MAG: baseplate J/gp47 family protein [Lachnospiraceae bacterium]|nr:baseplate J/gp47 family protein [Lachnospiraceae bacterium]